MLTGIGIIIILKQIPHFFGYNSRPRREFCLFSSGRRKHVFCHTKYDQFYQSRGDDHRTFGIDYFVAYGVRSWTTKGSSFKLVQGPLVAVAVGIIYFISTKGSTVSGGSHRTYSLVFLSLKMPLLFSHSLASLILGPSAIPQVWIVAFTIALVASLETLLCVEATDKIDPLKRVTPTNRELLAQGIGNIFSGLIGGLPVTQVIVRSSANIQSGGKTKMSAIIHGFLLLISVILIPNLLNKIPLSVLAAILFIVGYKLAKPALFIEIYRSGWKQFTPFIVTVLGIIFTDLLIGIALGLAVGIVVILIKSFQNSHFLHIEDKSNGVQKIKMTLAEEVTFFNKGAILKELDNLARESYLELDVTKTRYLDNDIIEILEDFSEKARA